MSKWAAVMENARGKVTYHGPFTTQEGAAVWAIANSGDELDFIHVIEIQGIAE